MKINKKKLAAGAAVVLSLSLCIYALNQHQTGENKDTNRVSQMCIRDRVRIAQLADKYTTSDGYIFDEHDIISDEGDAYVTPHRGHSHWIGKDSLSDKEKAAAQSYTKEKGILPPSADRCV